MKQKFTLWQTIVYIWATQAGIGYLKGGGTIISAIQAMFIWMGNYTPENYLFMVVGTFIFGYLTSSYVAKKENVNDPSIVVIDEVWGMMIALWGVPKILGFYLLAFLLFRFFDIVKPYPISALEKLPDGWGIMLDDGLAGLCSCGVIHILCYFLF